MWSANDLPRLCLSCSCRGYASRCLPDACNCTSVISQDQSPRIGWLPCSSHIQHDGRFNAPNQASFVNRPQHLDREQLQGSHGSSTISNFIFLGLWSILDPSKILSSLIAKSRLHQLRSFSRRSDDQLSPTTLSLFGNHISFSYTSRKHRQRQKPRQTTIMCRCGGG